MLKLSTKFKLKFTLTILISLVAVLVYLSWQKTVIVTSATSQNCDLAISWQSGEISSYTCAVGETIEQAIIKFKNRPDVKQVAPLRSYQLSLVPNDPGYQLQSSYLEKIKVPEVWSNVSNSTRRSIIAILDSGVDINNSDLATNIWFNPWEMPNDHQDNDNNGYIDDVNGWDFITNTADPRPKYEDGWTEIAMQHGTVVAGVAAAIGNNGVGVAGVDWQARLMPLRVLNARGVGNTVTVARAINYAVNNGANIINLSFVGQYSDPVLEEAINRAYQAGVLIVAASGNEAGNETGLGLNLNKSPRYPVCDDGLNDENKIIGVAAVDQKDVLASFSNYGWRCIDISAPGVNIFSTQFRDPTHSQFKDSYGGWWSGTSVATPLVSGALALLKEAYPKLTAGQLRDLLLAGGDQIDQQNPTVAGQIGRRLNLSATFALAESIKFSYKSPILLAPAQGEPQVLVFSYAGEKVLSFLAYHPNFRKGLNLASGDTDGNGQLEIITVPKAGGGPHVRIFNQDGQLLNQFMAFLDTFKGGLSLAVADFNNDQKDDIVIGSGKGITATVRIFSDSGQLLSQFFPYEDKYTGGIAVAAGDVDGDKVMELITIPQTVGNLPIRIFTRNGYKKYDFKPSATSLKGILSLSVGDVNNDGKDEIIAASGVGYLPQVTIFDYKGKILGSWLAYAKTFRGGVNVSVGDVDGDGTKEIITVPQTGGGPQVRIFNSFGQVKTQFYGYDKSFRGGLTVAAYR